ncbi:dipeptide/oligopeptide/nickel ABC transporter ATP-binding protein [Nocardiopsis terrae]|uniref:Peptide/nickel transport system ATP-binding protein n=1 Tax=Nocardiopsis terrae TaxID=372655 RepID=A0ABR9HK79_9ACTN|nr:ABC transporter ATP-binding protein [Nocardiopsis terrae]MBE1459421.1 peptide/nickel transport system ATP-binding protein [Nocardiopsis terrae]GHC97194.1 dipeptide/oligopeptide/nickel ABC transporter ATP-binding protein [Nocardiopsis terrae]
MTSLLDVRDLHVTYSGGGGDVPAVRGVHLSLDPGDTLGVAGESGSGKSTVALALLRLLPAGTRITGEILLEGEDVLRMRWGRLRAVRWAGASVVFQGAMHSLNPVQRIGEQIAEPLLVHALVKPDRVGARVADLLEQVGLPASRRRDYPHQLSGGQRQRVMIAMALACEPRLIIADEATTALDVMIQAQILALLERLVDESGIGMLMISHDLSVLAATCDRVAVMYAGRIVEQGPAGEVVHEPAHPYASALSAAFPRIGDPASRLAPRGLPGDPPDPAQAPSGCVFRPRCAVAETVCATVDPPLWPVRPDRDGRSARHAACVHVGPGGGPERTDSARDGSARSGPDPGGPGPGSAEEEEETSR